MAESKAGNKGLSIALLVIGAAMMGNALVLDFSGSSAARCGRCRNPGRSVLFPDY